MIRPSKKFIIIGVVILVVVIVAVLLSGGDNNSGQDQAPEKSGVPSVTFIDNDAAFYNSTTIEDYRAVNARLTDYVVSQNGDPWTIVEITDVKTSGQGSSIVSFKASIASLNQKDLFVEFDYGAQPFATFTIKEKGFNVPLYGGQD